MDSLLTLVELSYESSCETKTDFNDLSLKHLPDNSLLTFDDVKKLVFPNQDVVYIAEKKKIHSSKNSCCQARVPNGFWEFEDEETEIWHYFFEEDRLGNKIGHAHTYFSTKLDETPIICYNKTEEPFLNQGYGFRRFLTLKNYVENKFEKPLHSDTCFLDDNEEKIWQKAVRLGLAEKSKNPYIGKYVSILNK